MLLTPSSHSDMNQLVDYKQAQQFTYQRLSQREPILGRLSVIISLSLKDIVHFNKYPSDMLLYVGEREVDFESETASLFTS